MPGLVQWYDQVYGAPNPTTGVGTQNLTNIGGFTGSPWNGNGSTWTAGYITIHVTAAVAAVDVDWVPGINGLGFQGVADPNGSVNGVNSFIPEPGTGLMLASGLGCLGLMGRRNR